MSQERVRKALEMSGHQTKSLPYIQWSKNEILGHSCEEVNHPSMSIATWLSLVQGVPAQGSELLCRTR